MAVSSENLKPRAIAESWDWRAVVRLAAISRALGLLSSICHPVSGGPV